jgi:hypothetical protein
VQGYVDSQESLTGEDRPELSGTTKEVTKRNNTDHILDRLINWQYLLPPIKLFNKSYITLLSNCNNPPGDSLASSRAQEAHSSKTQEGENENEEQALTGNNERQVEGSPFCPDNSLSQGWVSC